MSADTADLMGDTIDATVTVTLGAAKVPLVLPPAEGLAFAASIDGVACCIVGADAIVHTDPGWRALRA